MMRFPDTINEATREKREGYFSLAGTYDLESVSDRNREMHALVITWSALWTPEALRACSTV